jgi:hypothetical protein
MRVRQQPETGHETSELVRRRRAISGRPGFQEPAREILLVNASGSQILDQWRRLLA